MSCPTEECEKKKTWLDCSRELAGDAEKARQAGEVVLSIALAVRAAECLQIHKLLTRDVSPVRDFTIKS